MRALLLTLVIALAFTETASAGDRSRPGRGLGPPSVHHRGPTPQATPGTRSGEVRSHALKRSTRGVQRNLRRAREERRLRSSGDRSDLERYERFERSKRAASDLNHDLDQKALERRLESDAASRQKLRALELQRDVDRSLDNVEFERRLRRLERETASPGR